jgi:LPXTG-site transpeptidase (sortase) family protein
MSGKRTITDHIRHTSSKPWEFLAVFLGVFFILALFLNVIDFVPEPSTEDVVSAENTQTVAGVSFTAGPVQTAPKEIVEVQKAQPKGNIAASATVYGGEEPVRIKIEKIGVDISVQNPISTNINVLDAALFKGTVRYPSSALLGANAGMLIFGHQSGLPVVKNKAFKAFNNLQQLQTDDVITVYSETTAYHYRVVSVEHASILDDVYIDFGFGKRTLTLTTCDSFGKKTDRYVVRSEFVSQEPLTQTNS